MITVLQTYQSFISVHFPHYIKRYDYNIMTLIGRGLCIMPIIIILYSHNVLSASEPDFDSNTRRLKMHNNK